MVAAFLVAGIAFLVNHDSALRTHVAAGELDVDVARYVAEAGLEHAKWAASDGNCGAYTDLVGVPFGSHTYTAVYSTESGSPVDIVTTGVLANGASRRLEASRQPIYQGSIDTALQPDAGAGKDTYVYQWQPAWSYGVNSRLQVENRIAGDWSNALVEFDLSLIPASARIISATLELYQASPSLPGGDFSIHRITSPWVEGDSGGGTGVPNWTQRDTGSVWSTPGGDYDPAPISTINIPAGLGNFAWDVTALVQSWTSGLSPNYGLAVVPASWGSAALFGSSDAANPDQHPILSITFACECGQVCALSGGSVEVPVSAASDDAEENGVIGLMYLDSSDLELAVDGVTSDTVGLRFAGVDVPAGAAITNAYIQFQVDETDSGTIDLTIRGEAADSAATFVSSAYDISNRALTSAAVSWSPPAWTIVGESDVNQQTPSIAPVIQEIVSRPGWSSGNAIAVVISGTGTRTAESFDGDSSGAAVLHIDFAGNSENSGGNVLFVVGRVSGAGPTTAELDHKALLESWGYSVELIDDDATQAEFDSAVLNSDVVFITNDVTASRVGTKLVGAAIGVVTSEDNLSDEFGMASSIAWDSGTNIEINDNTHYITEPFPVGLLPILSTSESLAYVTGTMSTDLGQLASSSSGYGVVTLEAGAAMYGGGSAAGRRAQLPWGGNGFDPNMLNADGLTLLKRAIEWGAGSGSGGGAGGGSGSYLDEFNAIAYNGDDGTYNWSNDWLEVAESDGPSSGILRVLSDTRCSSSNCIRIGHSNIEDQPTKALVREADLSSATTATLSYDYEVQNVDNKGTVLVRISDDGGSNWTTLATYTISSGSGSESFDISTYLASNTQIRVEVTGKYAMYVFIDNVRIDVDGGDGGGGGGGGGSCSGNFRDEFNTKSYSGNDGTLSWAIDWLEVGESDGPTSGDEQVVNDFTNYQLRTQDNNNGGEGAEREADLSGAASATLSYLYRRLNLDNGNDYTTVEISANGAAGPWTELARYQGPGTDSDYQPASHDISGFISATTRIRLKTSPNMGGQDRVFFDDIEIACTP